MTIGPEGPPTCRPATSWASGKVVLFAVPGAFTPTCSDYHLPSYVIRHDELRAKGVDTVACISVNDPFVMDAWGEAQHVGDSVTMLADGNGEFTAAIGLEMDGSGFGLGTRSQRYAMVLEDGVVTALQRGARRRPDGQRRRRRPRAPLAGPRGRGTRPATVPSDVELSEALRTTGAVREFRTSRWTTPPSTGCSTPPGSPPTGATARRGGWWWSRTPTIRRACGTSTCPAGTSTWPRWPPA